MLHFKAIELSDKPWIDEAVKAGDSRSADFNFANMYMWDESYRQLVAKVGGRMVAKPKYKHHPFFAFPIGAGDLKPVIDELRDYAAAHGFPFCISGVTPEHRAELEALFPGHLEFIPDRDHFDYVYLAEKLAELPGKKLHAKRTHINRFLEANNWSFEPLSTETLPECRAMLADWAQSYLDNGGILDGMDAEHAAIGRAFDHFDYLGLEGGALRVDGRLIAFTIGERISSDTFNIHFEKAYAEIQGAYPMVNREFVRQILAQHPDIVYINREDDMGHENLRKAKLSYDPEFLVEKFSACLCCGGKAAQ